MSDVILNDNDDPAAAAAEAADSLRHIARRKMMARDLLRKFEHYAVREADIVLRDRWDMVAVLWPNSELYGDAGAEFRRLYALDRALVDVEAAVALVREIAGQPDGEGCEVHWWWNCCQGDTGEITVYAREAMFGAPARPELTVSKCASTMALALVHALLAVVAKQLGEGGAA